MNFEGYINSFTLFPGSENFSGSKIISVSSVSILARTTMTLENSASNLRTTCTRSCSKMVTGLRGSSKKLKFLSGLFFCTIIASEFSLHAQLYQWKY